MLPPYLCPHHRRILSEKTAGLKLFSAESSRLYYTNLIHVHNMRQSSNFPLHQYMKKIFLLVFLSILFLQNTGRCADMTSIPQRGIAALKNKDYEQAYAEGQRMVKLNPRRPEGYKLMVLAH